MAAAPHLDVASWTLSAVGVALIVAMVGAIVSSWREHRMPRRRVSVFEAVFALRQNHLLDADEAQRIFDRYDELERQVAEAER